MSWIKRIGLGLIIILLIGVIGIGLFIYKASHGFPVYETEQPDLDIPKGQTSILLFSKTTAFRHGAAIHSLQLVLDSIARERGWYIYNTESAGVFNEAQLGLFDVVIWNNSTGPVLTKEQQTAFKQYINNGGGFVGIHGAGDFSHKWDWYTDELIGADFSHHPIKKQIQQATVYLSPEADTWRTPPLWSHQDEWYVFHNSPADKGAEIIYWIDGESIDPSGNLLFITNKDFGMGKKHPVVWTKSVGEGRSFYTSMGHNTHAVTNKNYLEMLVGGIEWVGGS